MGLHGLLQGYLYFLLYLHNAIHNIMMITKVTVIVMIIAVSCKRQ
jgi:hypothetical protein